MINTVYFSLRTLICGNGRVARNFTCAVSMSSNFSCWKFSTFQKDVLPSSRLLCHIRVLSERHGNGELSERPCLLKPYVCVFHFYLQNFFYLQEDSNRWWLRIFLLHSSYIFELKPSLRVQTSRHFITFKKAGSNLDFPGLNLKDGD